MTTIHHIRMSVLTLTLMASMTAWSVNCADEGPDAIIDLPTEKRIAGLATLWMEARQGFPYFDQVPKLDWDRTFEEFIPGVLAAESCYEWYLELQRFFARLEDGHTRVMIPRPAPNRFADVPPVAFSLVAGEIVIGFTADELADEVPLGSRVHHIDGRPAMDIVEERVLPLISSSSSDQRLASAVTGYSDWAISPLAGPPGSVVEIEFTTPDGERRSFELVRDLHSDLQRWAGSIQHLSPHPEHGLFHFEWKNKDIAYIWLGSFREEAIVDEFEQHLEALRERARAIVIDLRGNGGGSTAVGSAILRHLIDQPVRGSSWQSRHSVAVYRAWGELHGEAAQDHHRRHALREAWETDSHATLDPAAHPVIVPTIILTGPGTGSAAEDFLVYADDAPHFMRMGTPSRGSTGQSLRIDLPGGGSAMLVVKRDRFPDGRDIVGAGIEPDQRVTFDVDDLLAGRDPVLEVALGHAWLD